MRLVQYPSDRRLIAGCGIYKESYLQNPGMCFVGPHL